MLKDRNSEMSHCHQTGCSDFSFQFSDFQHLASTARDFTSEAK
jgi:hypothetical protein